MEDHGMDVDRPVKMEKDCAPLVDEQLPIIDSLAKGGKFMEALEQLLALEKQTRLAADLASTSRVLVHMVNMCVEAHDWKTLNEQIVLLSKKRGQLKQAIAKMVQEAMAKLETTPNMEAKLALIDTLLQVTEGKIYVEIEGARLTRMLAKIREDEGKIAEAADILQRLQVETYGSMERREKVDFILEQMRLLLAKSDFVRTQLVSKKINPKFFEKEDVSDLKLRYYQLMIEYGVHEEQYLEVCKHYYEIYHTKSVQESDDQWKEALQNIIIYAILAPFNNEQSDLLNRINLDKKLDDIPAFKAFMRCFLTSEIMNWADIERRFKDTVTAVRCVSLARSQDPQRLKQWAVVRDRVIEHNIRVISKYYSRIQMGRLSTLLELDAKDTEEYLSRLVVSKTIFGKINRPEGIVSFTPRKDPSELLNEWTASTNSLLTLIEKTTHLIAKEEMVHKITEVK